MIAAITDLISRTGAWGVFLLTAVENLFPPIPSELILPFAGYVSTTSRLSFEAAVIAGGAGSVLGAAAWYELGRRVGEARLLRWAERHGRWLTVTCGELRRTLGWLRRHRGAALLVGRMLPGVRGVICIPAGFSGMGRRDFLLWCGAGSFGWSLLLCAAGRALARRYDLVERWLSPVATAAFAAVALAYAYRVATFRPSRA